MLKGSERSPRCYWAIGSVLQEAGLPDGCLNVIEYRPQDAADVTMALIEHPSVKKISFTGSAAVGSTVAAAAGRNLKPILLELGGKASAIVLEDADIQLAAEQCARGALVHVCHSPEPLTLRDVVLFARFSSIIPERSNLHVHRTNPYPFLNRPALLHRVQSRCRKLLSFQRPRSHPR